jgi:hypothetical protein
MNAIAREFKPLDIDGLKRYKVANPTKFEHKYGDLDLNSLPIGFNLFRYKALVAKERSTRDAQGLPQDTPRITPDTIFPKPAPMAPVVVPEPLVHSASIKVVVEQPEGAVVGEKAVVESAESAQV